MNPVIVQNFGSSFSYVSAQLLTELSLYLPKIALAFLALVIGTALARGIRRLVVKTLDTLRVAQIVKNTPVDLFLKNAELGQRMEEVAGSVVYWLIMLAVLQMSVSILGLESISALLSRVLNYIPQVFSAILVLFFGVLVAGVIESVVKGSIKSIDGQSARFLGKLASYLVVSISVLAAVSELGIASQFIMILFIGLVAMVSLGMSLAIGLGAKDLVRDILRTWYEKTVKDVSRE